jgi:hypothetical protein
MIRQHNVQPAKEKQMAQDTLMRRSILIGATTLLAASPLRALAQGAGQ